MKFSTGALVVLGWILVGIAAGAYAARVNRTTYLLLLWLGPREDEDDGRLSCPFCADAVKPWAGRCPHCRSDLAPGDLTPTDAEMC